MIRRGLENPRFPFLSLLRTGSLVPPRVPFCPVTGSFFPEKATLKKDEPVFFFAKRKNPLAIQSAAC